MEEIRSTISCVGVCRLSKYSLWLFTDEFVATETLESRWLCFLLKFREEEGLNRSALELGWRFEVGLKVLASGGPSGDNGGVIIEGCCQDSHTLQPQRRCASSWRTSD